ncbi:integrin alpha-L [Amia ocellicauda]|uniref:integrin alpha-L n=1 Tax=Amia ocellicauda TaxID=2972642 RepID=UPI003463DFBF
MSPLWTRLLFVGFIQASWQFNIDVTRPHIINGSQGDYFGYKTLQFATNKENWIVVSAPLKDNGTGGIYKCAYDDSKCNPISLKVVDSGVKAIGLSLAAKSGQEPEITTCSPAMAHECDKNTYYNSICYQFDNMMMLTYNFTPAYQDCSKRNVDLVFLFDGSESLVPADFDKNKEFIWNIMRSLINSSIQFAAVQFSTEPRIEFTFNDYQKSKDRSKLLEKSVYMKLLTNTYNALNFTVDRLLYNTLLGAKADATKAILIITDGDPTDFDDYEISKHLEKNNVIRYVIGVGKVNLERIRILASEPRENNTFKIQDYAGLKGVLDNLQNKIYNIEGAKNADSKTFLKEVSQSGFSAIYTEEDTLMLGAVGSNSWRGAINEIGPLDSEDQISISDIPLDSYLGYSVAHGRRGEISLLMAGAPRSSHKGIVVIFQRTKQTIWNATQLLNGTQIGSYFGSELCALDLDSDGNTDFLLVGAPMHHGLKSEGMVVVYSLTQEVMFVEGMNVSGEYGSDRFGSALAALQDINGDGLTDVAVGAPLENGHQGAVYIYLGNKQTGINIKFSQHIPAKTLSSGLQHFGQSIDGMMDMSKDGLTDITVGALGTVVTLRSRPVLSVTAKLSFTPNEIPISNFHCLDQETTKQMITLTVCFDVSLATIRKGEAPGLNLSYQLGLDSVRQNSRAFFDASAEQKLFQNNTWLPLNKTCYNNSIYMKNCVEDTRSPIKITLKFSQQETHDSADLTPILNIASEHLVYTEVPFQKNCGGKDDCTAELKLEVTLETHTLFVVNQGLFNLTIKLLNKGDDSYNTTLQLVHPVGLSFSKLETIQASRRTIPRCMGQQSENQTLCRISIPVYPGKTNATFFSMFRVSVEYDWNNVVEMHFIAHSDNGNDTLVSKSLPVQFAIDLTIRELESNTYVNFSLEESSPKVVWHSYEVKNLGLIDVPVNVTFIVPTQCENNFEWTTREIEFNKDAPTRCYKATDMTENSCSDKKCKKCKKILCSISKLKKGSSVQYNISGEAHFHIQPGQGKYSFSEKMEQVNFFSSAHLSYDNQRYIQYSASSLGHRNDTKFHTKKISTEAELSLPPHKAFIIVCGAGGGLFILVIIIVVLYLLGFFKRKKPDFQTNNAELDKSPVDAENELHSNPGEDGALISDNPKDNNMKERIENGSSPEKEETSEA